jgi:hypothetical protein
MAGFWASAGVIDSIAGASIEKGNLLSSISSNVLEKAAHSGPLASL